MADITPTRIAVMEFSPGGLATCPLIPRGIMTMANAEKTPRAASRKPCRRRATPISATVATSTKNKMTTPEMVEITPISRRPDGIPSCTAALRGLLADPLGIEPSRKSCKPAKAKAIVSDPPRKTAAAVVPNLRTKRPWEEVISFPLSAVRSTPSAVRQVSGLMLDAGSFLVTRFSFSPPSPLRRLRQLRAPPASRRGKTRFGIVPLQGGKYRRRRRG